MVSLAEHRYGEATTVVVLEGVRDGEAVSLVAAYRDGIDRARKIWGDPVRPLASLPSDVETGADPVTNQAAASQSTATLVATTDVINAVLNAHNTSRFDTDTDEDLWLFNPDATLLQEHIPGRNEVWIADEDWAPQHLERWHTTSTAYRVTEDDPSLMKLEASTPPPLHLEDYMGSDEFPLFVYSGDFPLLGRRMLICEVSDEEISVEWFGFIDGFSLNSQQNELEVSARGPLDVLKTSGVNKRDVQIYDFEHSPSVYGLADVYEGEYQIASHDLENTPVGDAPGEIVIETTDGASKCHIVGVYDFDELEASRPLPQQSDFSFASQLGDDPDPEIEGSIAFGYDPDGVLGGPPVGIGQQVEPVTAVELCRRYLEYFYIRPRTTELDESVTLGPENDEFTEAVSYDGAVWNDSVDLGEFEALEDTSPRLDHYLITSETSLRDLAEGTLYPYNYMLRLTDEGRVGVAQVRVFSPDDVAEMFPDDESSETSSRGVLLSDRINLDFPIRLSEATYKGIVGDPVDRIDADTVEITPDFGVGDLTTSYISGEKRYSFPYIRRGDANRTFEDSDVAAALLDYRQFYRQAPIFSCIVQQEHWTEWIQREGLQEHAEIPHVGDLVRMDGGPLTGLVGPDGKRIEFAGLDILPIGLITRKVSRWEDRTAELEVLMVHWDADVIARQVAPSAKVVDRQGDDTLVIDVSEAGELQSRSGDLGFLIGDNVQLYDGYGAPVGRPDFYQVDSIDEDTITLDVPLSSDDQTAIDVWADSRGIVLRLSDPANYQNHWDETGYFIEEDNAERKWTYWGLNDYWVMS